MKIEKFKKIGNGKYKIITESDEIILYEEVILKYNLLYNKELNLEQINKILKDNEYYEIYNLSIKYIEIKMRSKEELIKYLVKKNFDIKVIEEVIKKLEEINLLNDFNYLKAFVNDKINLTNYGPYKIKEELLKNKIEENDIDEYLNNIDSTVWIEKINKIINKKIKLNKNKSNNLLKKTLYNELLYLGYTNELISISLENIKFDEINIISKEYEKSKKRLNKKYKNELLNEMIKKDLLKKGFNYDTINEYVNNN